MALQIDETITDFPHAPNSATDNETQFNLKSDAWVGHMGVFTPEANQWATEANALSLELNGKATQVETDATQVATDKTFVSNNTAKLAAYAGRNILLDGEVGRINQSAFDGNWANVADSAYGFDIWMKESDTTIKQIVEEGNFAPGAEYTLSGVGVTEQQITSPASGNWVIGGIPNTATLIQVERGAIATPFEILPYSDQLARVQRYFVQFTSPFTSDFRILGQGHVESTGKKARICVPLCVPMRDRIPTIGYSSIDHFDIEPFDYEVLSIAIAKDGTEMVPSFEIAWSNTLTEGFSVAFVLDEEGYFYFDARL